MRRPTNQGGQTLPTRPQRRLTIGQLETDHRHINEITPPGGDIQISRQRNQARLRPGNITLRVRDRPRTLHHRNSGQPVRHHPSPPPSGATGTSTYERATLRANKMNAPRWYGREYHTSPATCWANFRTPSSVPSTSRDKPDPSTIAATSPASHLEARKPRHGSLPTTAGRLTRATNRLTPTHS